MSEEKAGQSGTFRNVGSRVEISEMEHGVLDYWERENIFEKTLEQTKDGELFSFYDGPPYATGKPHYGHILQSAIKDTVLRYKTMRGYHVPRHVGWDCHGLPVETLVEKELGLAGKREIEEFGIEKFNQTCKETVLRYVDDFTQTLKRLGRWADYGHAYATLDRDYMESEWWVFKQLWEQELIYKGSRAIHICPRCETPLSNFEVTQGYKDRFDQSVIMTFPLEEDPNTVLLAWTTTPWSLPGNLWLLMSPDIEYVRVNEGETTYIVAKKLVESVFKDREYTEAGVITAEELAGKKYVPLFDYFVDKTVPSLDGETYGEKAFFVLMDAGGEVSDSEGTGIVHITSAHGEDGFRIAQAEGVDVLHHLEIDGSFKPEARDFEGLNAKPEGKKPMATDLRVIEVLKDYGRYFNSYTYKHSYPHCWRCDTPLLNYALDTWFVAISSLKDQMRENARQINWTPTHVKEGRFGKGIDSAPDWSISRNRFWSVPMPIWECDACDERVCVGSMAELLELSGRDDVEDLHRPYVDDVTWECVGDACAGAMHRVPEVLDVWFDSGSMPYAQWHYPFENKETVEQLFPADFIVEAIEQTRLWFYVLHVLGAALTKKDIGLGEHSPAFKNAIGAGMILAKDGRKLSKKLKNYPEPEPTIEKYGADVIRFYLLSSASLGEAYRFDEKDLRQVQRNVHGTLWNVYSFFVRYSNVAGFEPGDLKKQSSSRPRLASKMADATNVLDRWILERLKEVQNEIVEATDAYQVDRAARAFVPFIDDLSNWYVRRSRERFQVAGDTDAQDSEAAFATLYVVLVETAKLLAPFMPFVAEEMYRNLTGGESVHLEQIEAGEELAGTEQDELEAMRLVRMVVTEGLALRAKVKIKVRQPLRELVVVGERLDEALVAMVLDEVNVKQVLFVEEVTTLADDDRYVVSEGSAKLQAGLLVEVDEELQYEGMAREIIRHGQMLRKEAGYALDDRIELVVAADGEEFRQMLDAHRDAILQALQADGLADAAASSDTEKEVSINGIMVRLGVKRLT